MSTPTQDDIKQFLPRITDDLLQPLEMLLELIDCPEDFRGLQKVQATLEYIWMTNSTSFCSLTEIDETSIQRIFELFSNIDEDSYKQYSNDVQAKGWMSRRPLYSLLFIFYEHQTPEASSALLFFLQHYYQFESSIIANNRSESSIRAFRLLYTDPIIDRICFDCISSTETADNIRRIRESLTTPESVHEDYSLSSRIGYLRDLEHFYRLDWKQRISTARASNQTLRASFSRRKIERIIGSDDLYTASLNNPPLAKDLVESGVTASEDYPELLIVRTEQPDKPKPKHERADISVIKDKAKIHGKNKAISKAIRRSHNITLLSRNVLQPHELHCLWQSLNTHPHSYIKDIPKAELQCILHLMLLTGRHLDNICNLPISYKDNGTNTGLVVNQSKVFLRVAPRPTANRGKHSSNKSLLKTKSLATIFLPDYFYQIFHQSILRGQPKVASLHHTSSYRKAIESLLKKLNQRYHYQISLKRIENYLVNRTVALEQDDPVILEILRGELSYYSRSPRHYAWYSESELNDKVQALWSETFSQIKRYDPDFKSPMLTDGNLNLDDTGIGSQFTPTQSAISQWVSAQKRRLQQLPAFDVAKNIHDLIEYHNQYTIYTLIMLINASGYRAVYNPLPSFDLLLLRYRALCISDKDSLKTFSHTRIIACPSILETQLKYYLQHAQALANLIVHIYPYQAEQLYSQTCHHQLLDLKQAEERKSWFLSIKNSRGNDGLFFLFIDDKDDRSFYQTKNAGPRLLRDCIDLPLNFGRHYIRRYLQMADIHQELIKFQLGHWVTGETPLEKCSSLIHSEAIEQLCPVLNDMLIEIGWNALPSLITRKRR